jgi:adenine-specific DNA-methyltransferase
MSTAYHSQFWAHALTLKSSSDSIDNLSRSLSNARVDLNPHQVDAALFAFRSPLSKGAILADEVGLGKTIEAGIVLSQRWAERRRKILLVLPATLRKQWQQELEEKFYLPTLILESQSYNTLRDDGHPNPFDQNGKLVICSYHFASAKADDIRRVGWDLVVIDEAHRLRNIYKPANKIAKNISGAVSHCQKLLLTATPLQNSLMELYGLVSVIDPHVFGDIASFREQFSRDSDEDQRNTRLRERLKPLCTRTLRKQVLEYIRFTQRVPITQDFLPTDQEHRLYQDVSAYLQREVLIALPSSQRKLMTMVLRKLLASSTFAIAGTLRGLVRRLEDLAATQNPLDNDYETLDEVEDEWEEEITDEPPIDPKLLQDELAAVRAYAELADSIQHNAKGEALLSALKIAFERTARLGAQKKAVIFTESRRTQQYLFDLLTANGYADRLAMLNGTNTDPHSRKIYDEWLKRNEGGDLTTGSRAVDVKAAIVDEFRKRATILIATEAAAEGVNLQFCSLVVNFDLPWNPQRIEQRIGRCHRYGQEHDVVVVNFLNRRNAADQRVFQLLAEKFRLFDGVFGASDEVLGALESGVDIEKRIAAVYQECRTPEEIQTAFDALQAELEEQVQSRLAETRKALLDNFDEEVHARLKVHRNEAYATLSEREQWLLSLTRQELGDYATFDPKKPRFFYTGPDSRIGNYHLDWKQAEKSGDMFYRVDHPLAVRLIQTAIGRQLLPISLLFDYRAHGAKVAALEPFLGCAGWLELSKLMVQSLDTEEFLVFAARTDDGVALDGELCRKLMTLPARIGDQLDSQFGDDLNDPREAEIASFLKTVDTRNGRFFDEEVNKLELWSDDLKLGLEREIKDLDQQIKDARREAQGVSQLVEKLAAQKRLKTLETDRTRKRRELYDAQDAIDQQRGDLIAKIEQQLDRRHQLLPLFSVRWSIA